MDMGDATWLWQYGLDGIISGVIGGGVTAWAVLWTLRSERQRTGRSELRAELAQLENELWELSQVASAPSRWIDQSMRVYLRLIASSAAAVEPAIDLAGDLDHAADVITEIRREFDENAMGPRDMLLTFAGGMLALLNEWRFGPDAYTHQSPWDFENAEGTFTLGGLMTSHRSRASSGGTSPTP